MPGGRPGTPVHGDDVCEIRFLGEIGNGPQRLGVSGHRPRQQDVQPRFNSSSGDHVGPGRHHLDAHTLDLVRQHRDQIGVGPGCLGLRGPGQRFQRLGRKEAHDIHTRVAQDRRGRAVAAIGHQNHRTGKIGLVPPGVAAALTPFARACRVA